MKKKQILKKSKIGNIIEFTNIELTAIKTKWIKIKSMIVINKKITIELVKDIEQFNSLIESICENTTSLNEINKELFLEPPLNEDSLKKIIDASTDI